MRQGDAGGPSPALLDRISPKVGSCRCPDAAAQTQTIPLGRHPNLLKISKKAGMAGNLKPPRVIQSEFKPG
jgi:hypothetical protein